MKSSILALLVFGLATSQSFSCEIIDIKTSMQVKSNNSRKLGKVQVVEIKIDQDFTNLSDVLSFAKGIASRYNDPSASRYVEMWFYNTKDVNAGNLDNHHTYVRFTPNEKAIVFQNEAWYGNSFGADSYSSIDSALVEKQDEKTCQG